MDEETETETEEQAAEQMVNDGNGCDCIADGQLVIWRVAGMGFHEELAIQ